MWALACLLGAAVGDSGACLAKYQECVDRVFFLSGSPNLVQVGKYGEDVGSAGTLKWFTQINEQRRQCELVVCGGSTFKYVSVRGEMGTEVTQRFGADAKLVHDFGMCVPSACDLKDGVGSVTEAFLRVRVDAPPGAFEFKEAAPLAAWSDVKIDFVIGGMPKTGTTSLAHFLDGVDGLALADARLQRLAEDFFFFGSTLLPTRAEVDAFNARHAAPAGTKRGIKHPTFLFRDISLAKLRAANPNATLVVAVRDPIDWLESNYNFFYSYMGLERPSFPEHALRLTQPSPKYRIFRREMHFSRAIRHASKYVSVNTLHLPSLGETGAARLAEVLGVPAPGRGPGLVNKNKEKVFDLCVAEREDANVSLAVRALQRELTTEYSALARLVAESGYAVPPEIVLGWHRCERKRRR